MMDRPSAYELTKISALEKADHRKDESYGLRVKALHVDIRMLEVNSQPFSGVRASTRRPPLALLPVQTGEDPAPKRRCPTGA